MTVAFLANGRIVHQQPLDDLMEISLQVTGSTDLVNQLSPKKNLRSYRIDETHSRILGQWSAAQSTELLARTDLRVERLSLEDLFIEMTK
jgi:ABC-2 type transport system ATP-binding protein